MEERVLVDFLRTIGFAVAAHVRRDRVEAGFGESLQLMTPGIPGFGKTVAQEHQRSRAALRDVHADAVGLDDAMFYFAHGSLLVGDDVRIKPWRRALPRGAPTRDRDRRFA